MQHATPRRRVDYTEGPRDHANAVVARGEGWRGCTALRRRPRLKRALLHSLGVAEGIEDQGAFGRFAAEQGELLGGPQEASPTSCAHMPD